MKDFLIEYSYYIPSIRLKGIPYEDTTFTKDILVRADSFKEAEEKVRNTFTHLQGLTITNKTLE